ncbi:RraA family protein [Ihubacter sp. rT4E-8]|uniref:RraA family protein n=1 Tax=Ihubacter sp. rT4E-8 TaxID=3242369 RepID=UPI003CEF1B1C
MGNVNCRVYNDFERPSKELIEQFRGIPAANLDDCMGRQAAVNSAIKPIGKAGLVGPAFTVKVAPGDNLMFHYAMDLVKEGDVIVIDAGGYTERAIFGEIMVHYLLTKKIAGIIVDGAMRDKEDIAATGLPVYTRAVIPDGPWKNGPGEVNTTVNCGGRSVSPGDIVVADADGIVFIKPSDAASILEKVHGLMAGEAKSLKTIQETGTLIRPWVMEKLQALGCEFFDKA